MTSIIITLLIVLYRIPFINILGDKGMGYYSIALAVYMFFMTCIAYGVPNAVANRLMFYNTKKQYAMIYKTFRCALFYALITATCTALVLILGAEIIARYVMNVSGSALAIRAFALCLIPISLLGVFYGLFKAIRLEKLSDTIHRVENIFIAILSILFVILFKNIQIETITEASYEAAGGAVGYLVSITIALVFAFIMSGNHRKKIKRYALKEYLNVSRDEILKGILIAMIPYVATLAIFHLSNILDYAIFSRMMSVQGHKENSYILLLGMLNGKYGFFISIPLLIINWFATKKIPILSKIVEEGNKRKIVSKIGQYIRYSMLLVIPWTFMYVLHAFSFMNLVFTGTNDIPALLLRVGAVSVIFYSLAAISNAVLTALENWASVARNAMAALIIQVVLLLIMMIVFQWGIIAVVISRIVFAAALCILNEHTLRERTGYVQEQKKTFKLPIFASIVMGLASLLIFFIFDLIFADKAAVVIAVLIGIPVYLMSLVCIGGITQRELYRIPGGKYLAIICRKLHLLH